MLKFRSKDLLRALGLLAACLLVRPLTAQAPQPAGPSVQVNTVQGANSPQIAWRCDADITMVVWSGASQGSDPDTSIQGRFFAGVTPTGPQFQVNQITANNQQSPKVRVLENGDFAVAWRTRIGTNGPYSFHLRTYDRITLAPRAEQEFGMVIDDNGDDFEFDIAEDGRVALVWEETPFIFAQAYDLNGQPSGPELSLEVESEVQGNPFSIRNPFVHLGTEVTALRWQTDETIFTNNDLEDRKRIQFQRFQQDGTPIGSTVTAISAILFNGEGPSIKEPKSHLTRNGDILFSYVYVWFPIGKDELFSLFTKRYGDDGPPTQFVTAFDTYTLILDNHDLKAEEDGDFMVVWDANEAPFANRIALDAAEAEPRFTLTDTAGTPHSLTIDYNGPGSPFAAAWVDNGIHWRRFLSYPNMLQDGFESGDTSRWCVARSAE